jgi:hypothetical protein
MKLCIDAMMMLYTNPGISTFVFVAGDRDYIPVIKHLQKNSKTVRVIGYPGSVSGDLLTILGDEFFIDAMSLVPDAQTKPAIEPVAVPTVVTRPSTNGPLAKPSGAKQVPITRAAATPDCRILAPGKPLERAADQPLVPNSKRALEIMLQYYGDKREVWMRPFLQKLRNELQELTEFDRKQLIHELADAGAVRVEQRNGHNQEGEEIHFSVMIINWNHPAVRAANQ